MTEKFFDYIMSYSPINNIKDGAVYPACLITGGLHDPRVQASEVYLLHVGCHFLLILSLNRCVSYFQRKTLKQMQYWEPAKFCAELRHRSSDKSGSVVLKMDMDSGAQLIVFRHFLSPLSPLTIICSIHIL